MVQWPITNRRVIALLQIQSTKAIFSRGQTGQTAVELALLLPFLLLIVFALIDFGFIMHGYIIVTQSAREGARAGSFGDTDAQITSVAQAAASTLPSQHLYVYIDPAGVRSSGNTVSVKVVYHYLTLTPVLHQLWPSVNVSAVVKMRVE